MRLPNASRSCRRRRDRRWRLRDRRTLRVARGTVLVPRAAAVAPGRYLRLRATATQAIPPIDRFPIPPVATITGDGTYITVGPQDAMYPGPALPNLIGRRRSPMSAGRGSSPRRSVSGSCPARPTSPRRAASRVA